MARTKVQDNQRRSDVIDRIAADNASAFAERATAAANRRLAEANGAVSK